MPTLSVYIKDKPTEKNPSCIYVFYTENSTDWCIADKNLKHKGVWRNEVAQRKCTQEEYDVENAPGKYRLYYIKYDDWDKFINDELKYCKDEGWIERLNELKKQFPQFDRKGQLSLDNTAQELNSNNLKKES